MIESVGMFRDEKEGVLRHGFLISCRLDLLHEGLVVVLDIGAAR